MQEIAEIEPALAARRADEFVLNLLTGGHQPRRADLRFVGGLLGAKHEPERVFARAEAMLKWARIAKPTADREKAAKAAKKFTDAAKKVREANQQKIAELQREIDQAESAAFQSEKAVSQMTEAFNKIREFAPLWLTEAVEDESSELIKNTRRPMLDAESDLKQIEVALSDGKLHSDHREWLDWLRLNFPQYLIQTDGRVEVSPQLAADRPQLEAQASELRERIADLEKRYQSGLTRIEQMIEAYCDEVTNLQWAG